MPIEDEDSVTADLRNNGNRIQKLLFTEYKEFEDMVLIESPFAQTTRDGQGIRQIQMGLTPTKLIMAGDVLCKGRGGSCFCNSCLWPDEDEESLELISVCPVEWVNVSVFRRHSRNTLKARFCNNRVLYFELAASNDRQMFWNLWCERVKFLCPEEPKSTQSETSVGSSTSESVQPKDLIPRKGKSVSKSNGGCRWHDRNLFLGHDFERGAASELPENESRINPPFVPSTQQYTSVDNRDRDSGNWTEPSGSKSVLHQVNRFGQGIDENCSAGLCLPTFKQTSCCPLTSLMSESDENYQGWCERETWVATLMDEAVLQWEQRHRPPEVEDSSQDNTQPAGRRKQQLRKDWTGNARRRRLKRRYSFQPLPHFMYGLGPWKLSRNQAYSLQVKRASSEVCLRSRLGEESEFRLGVPRRQLTARMSSYRLPIYWENATAENASLNKKQSSESSETDSGTASHTPENNFLPQPARVSRCNRYFVHQRPPVGFWTPNHWYRPTSETHVFHRVRAHMESLQSYLERTFRNSSSSQSGHTKRRILLPWKSVRKKKNAHSEATSKCSSFGGPAGLDKAAPNVLNDHLTMVSEANNHPVNTQVVALQLSSAKSEQSLTAWDFNSTLIAYQLTLIDRDLFKKLTEEDLMAALLEGNAKNSPNLAAMIAFSHRTTNLVSSQILSIDSVKLRARMIARYINVADKLHRLHNLQSATSVLAGLQLPSIFRLDRTWRYIRARHSTKYERLLTLLRMYREPRSLEYERMVERSSRTEPYLPPTPYILAALLAKLPHPTSLLPFADVASGHSFCSGRPGMYRGVNYMSTMPKCVMRCMSPLMLSSLRSCDSTNSDPANISCQSYNSGDTDSYPISKLGRYFEAVREEELEPGRRVELLIASVGTWQRAAEKYALPVSKLALQFVTLTPYKEELDNFVLSLRLEPPHQGSDEENRRKYKVSIEDSPSNERV